MRNNRQELRTAPQSDIFKSSIEQFGRELSQFFPNREKNTPTFLIKSSGDLKDIREQKQDNKFAIPLFTYKLESMTPIKDRFNRGALRRRGLFTSRIVKPTENNRLADPNAVFDTLHLTPVEVAFEVIYICSYAEQLDFGPLWQQAAQAKYLSFDLEVADNVDIKIKVELNEDITFTDISFDDQMSYIQCATSATMSTYHGVVSKVKPFHSLKVDTGIVAHGDTDKEDKQVQPSMTIRKNKDTTFSVKSRIDGE